MLTANQENYIAVYTTAELAYDYAYSFSVKVVGQLTKKDLRMVLIPEEKVAYQEGRYLSGTNFVSRDITDVRTVLELERKRQRIAYAKGR